MSIIKEWEDRREQRRFEAAAALMPFYVKQAAKDFSPGEPGTLKWAAEAAIEAADALLAALEEQQP